jgi:acetyl-CoA carboxylase biotin carboxyl carrier protein
MKENLGASADSASETETLKELLEIMHEHDLDALKVKVGDKIFELVRREAGISVLPMGGAAAMPAAQHAAAAPGGAPGTPAAPANAKKVTAPLVGVFYRSPAPDAEAFVKVGDRVEVGQVLCILEAMKLFNEIISDYAGVVTRIIPENGELVSLGQEMFWIEP